MNKEIDIRTDKISKENDYSDVKKIIFADSDGGFDASFLLKTEESVELDSGYINPSDLDNLNKAIKFAIFLGWNV